MCLTVWILNLCVWHKKLVLQKFVFKSFPSIPKKIYHPDVYLWKNKSNNYYSWQPFVSIILQLFIRLAKKSGCLMIMMIFSTVLSVYINIKCQQKLQNTSNWKWMTINENWAFIQPNVCCMIWNYE